MIIRATFSTDGFPTGFFPEDVWPSGYPDDAFEIAEAQWREFLENPGARRWSGGKVVEFTPPPDPVSPRIVYKADIWRRATDEEAEAIDYALNSQSIRLQRMWADAAHLSSDDDLFSVVESAFIAAFGAERTAELLA